MGGFNFNLSSLGGFPGAGGAMRPRFPMNGWGGGFGAQGPSMPAMPMQSSFGGAPPVASLPTNWDPRMGGGGPPITHPPIAQPPVAQPQPPLMQQPPVAQPPLMQQPQNFADPRFGGMNPLLRGGMMPLRSLM